MIKLILAELALGALAVFMYWLFDGNLWAVIIDSIIGCIMMLIFMFEFENNAPAKYREPKKPGLK